MHDDECSTAATVLAQRWKETNRHVSVPSGVCVCVHKFTHYMRLIYALQKGVLMLHALCEYVRGNSVFALKLSLNYRDVVGVVVLRGHPNIKQRLVCA